MNKEQIKSIIEATLKAGAKTPGMFDLPKIISIKSKLETCSSVADVVGLLEENRGLLCGSFGISDAVFDGSLEKLKLLA